MNQSHGTLEETSHDMNDELTKKLRTLFHNNDQELEEKLRILRHMHVFD